MAGASSVPGVYAAGIADGDGDGSEARVAVGVGVGELLVRASGGVRGAEFAGAGD